jgi:hypothetical protein
MAEQLTTEQLASLAKLREPFPDNLVSYRPVQTCGKEEYKALPKGTCKICGGYHATSKTTHLSYVGHAALTSRLLEVDPTYQWEPFSLTEEGLPRFDDSGGLWIRLTIHGITRPGYGHAVQNPYSEIGSREKEVIGDALRNAAMRFGAALEMWHKGDLHVEEGDDDAPPVETPTVAMPKSKKAKAAEPAAPVETAEAAEIGEINFIKGKFKALRQVTPSDVLVEAGCDSLNPDTLEGLTKAQFAVIRNVLKASK